jgi:hypothetical protein
MNHPNQNYYYAILVIIASICYAVNVNLIKSFCQTWVQLASQR